MSALVPMAGIWAFSMRQRGHGQPPKYFIVAKRTLQIISTAQNHNWIVLFGVICPIGKKSRKDQSLDTIVTSHNNSVNIGVYELWGQQQVPDAVHQLPFQVSHHVGRWSVPKFLPVEVFYRGWQLRMCQKSEEEAKKNKTTTEGK